MVDIQAGIDGVGWMIVIYGGLFYIFIMALCVHDLLKKIGNVFDCSYFKEENECISAR